MLHVRVSDIVGFSYQLCITNVGESSNYYLHYGSMVNDIDHHLHGSLAPPFFRYMCFRCRCCYSREPYNFFLYLISLQVGTSTTIPFFVIFSQLSLTVIIPLLLGQVTYNSCISLYRVFDFLIRCLYFGIQILHNCVHVCVHLIYYCNSHYFHSQYFALNYFCFIVFQLIQVYWKCVDDGG